MDRRSFAEGIAAGRAAGLLETAGSILREVADDHRLLAEATQHVLGFMHLRIAEFSGYALRLHIWPTPQYPPALPVWLVHTHAWRLSSLVVVGEVENRIYDVAEAPDGEHRLYEVVYEGDHSKRVSLPARVSCRRATTDRIGKGVVYEVPAGAYHSTVVDDGVFAVTFVVTEAAGQVRARVVGGAEGQDEYGYDRVRIGIDAARGVVSQAIERLT
jgi:hypothetical protein